RVARRIGGHPPAQTLVFLRCASARTATARLDAAPGFRGASSCLHRAPSALCDCRGERTGDSAAFALHPPRARVLPFSDRAAPRGPSERESMTSATTQTPSFADLGVPARLVDVLVAEGRPTPFPIQQATLPSTLAGRDVLGRGKTGS